jgi:small subunit ribosomal protein S9
MVRTAKSTQQESPKPAQLPLAHGVGRRKKSVARVWLTRGGRGKFLINGRALDSYFDTEIARLRATEPMKVLSRSAPFDINVTVEGGGLHGQADAVKVGLARALVLFDEALKPVLRQYGALTVDARVKERKKYGQKAARRKFQFVKR